MAAGGGSRLFFKNGLFVVGPESAGAHPGKGGGEGRGGHTLVRGVRGGGDTPWWGGEGRGGAHPGKGGEERGGHTQVRGVRGGGVIPR